MKGLCSRPGAVCAGTAFWVLYACLELRHFYETSLVVPPTQRVVRRVEELRLPRLYFCPADRGRTEAFRWRSFECILTYKEDHTSCPARIQGYSGRAPERFDGHKPGTKGGECLEFGTHMIGVREEHSAAWNEITLRASFDPGRHADTANALQEVELGYLPEDWEIGMRSSTLERFYYPLLRVPIFFLGDSQSRPQSQGVATRTYLGKEVDRGHTHAGRYWYTYGAMQLSVENATLPRQSFMGADVTAPDRMGVVHVVITLEDFEEYDFQVVSCFFPFLAAIGQIAGVAALLSFALFGRVRGGVTDRASGGRAAGGAGGAAEAGKVGSSGFSADCGKEVGSADEEGEEEEEALLGAEAPRERAARRGEDAGGAGQALLGGEEGGDGL